MAGDWIKMRVGLTTNPRVMRIAECLIEEPDFLAWAGLTYGVPNFPPVEEANIRAERHAALRVTRYVTVTALLRWWGYANEHAKGEFIAGVFPEDVDEIAGVPGFASAIEAAGWVEFNPEGGVSLPNFHEHNTSADARSSGAERQKRYRERHKQEGGECDVTRNVTRNVTVTHREEKRREEKETPIVPLPDWLDSGLWGEFVAHRREIGKPLTDRATGRMLAKLVTLREQGVDVKAAIDASIRNRWQDVFAPKDGPGKAKAEASNPWDGAL